ncbi:hypothetical protein J3F83DRAFT_729731 [Trichoderma novae-zelandiae]
MKDKNEVIQEFKELVNMTAQELKEWLKGDDSTSAGWTKDDGSGESVGHDSGRRIVEILESNPDKDPEKYTDDDISHMRKVVSYCKRHLAQEEKANNEKPIEDVKKTKSYASLKNWGHDPIKKRQANGGGAQDKGEQQAEEKEEQEEQEENKQEKAGEKRKAQDDQSGKSKKRETEDGAAEVKDDDEQEEQEEDAEGEESNEKESKNGQHNGKGSASGNKAKGPKEGETVSWNWGQGQPEGKVKEVNPDTTTIQTKKGNKVTRKGDEEDPAVVLDTGKTEAVKLNHELNETED